ncbi:MAG: preprotein translocase subunit YajC, partial [Planctomycetota bacterium]
MPVSWMLLPRPAQPEPAEPAPGGAAPFSGMLLPMVLIGVVFWLFLIRPANKKEKARRQMIDALRKHDRV